MLQPVKRWSATLTLIGILVFAGVLFVQLQIAFGWTNPTQAPPGGSGLLSVMNNNLGVNYPAPATAKVVVNSAGMPGIDVDPSGSASGRIIGLTPTPAANDEAASKAYVDAQVGGSSGGGKPILTLFGMSGPISPFVAWTPFPPVVTINNCLRGNWEACQAAINSMPAAGKGVTCPTGWSSIYAGFGPYVFLEKQFYYRNPVGTSYSGGPIRSSDDLPGDILVGGDIPQIPANHVSYSQVGVTYSICGESPILAAKTDFSMLVSPVTIPGAEGVGTYAGILNACVPQANNTYVCNTCRICQQQ